MALGNQAPLLRPMFVGSIAAENARWLPTVRNGLFLAISYQNGYLTIRIVTFLGYLLSFLEARASLVVRILVVHSVTLDFLG